MKKLIVSITILLLTLPAWAQIPKTISFQGYLTDKTTGDPIDGNRDMKFSLHDAVTGGNELWFEEYTAVPVTKGLYNVTLGSKTTINLAFNQVYYLQMKVGLEILDTRLALNSAAYSLSAASAANLATGTVPNERLDAELQDLADGSLSGSLVGSGVSAGNISGKLAVANGGTGADALTGIVIGNGAGTMTAVAKTGGSQYFRSNAANNGYEFVGLSITNTDIAAGAAIAGTKVNPSFGSQTISTSGSISGGSLSGALAASNITGTLPVGNGGTGAISMANGVLFGNGTAAFTSLATANAGYYLRRNLSNNGYEFAQLNIQGSDISDNSIADADISANAAIAGTKVLPNFGAKNIATTGNVNAAKIGLNVTGTTTLHVSHGSGFTTNGITLENSTVASSNWNFYVNASGDLALYKAGALKGTFGSAGGTYSPSDRRLKKDIEPIGDITADLMALTPSTYHFKDQDTNELRSFGFIAQDVMKIFPSLVKHNEENDIYTLDYSGFGVLAVKAIQEQQQKIDDLTNQIMELKRAVETLQLNLKK